MSLQQASKSATRAATTIGRPVFSQNREEARRRVLRCYKVWQQHAARIWDKNMFYYMPLTEWRLLIKSQFLVNASIKDPRVIDRLCHRAELTLLEARKGYLNKEHIHNMIVRSNLEKKPTDFLSRFFAGKD